MKKIDIISVGKIKEAYWQKAILEYSKRLQTDISLTFHNIKALSFDDKNKELIKTEETQKLLDYIEKNVKAKLFFLSEDGKEYDSIDFSSQLYSFNERIAFVIAGSLGFDKRLISAYNKISLSKLTFIHEMAQVILLEQIYRAVNIYKNKKYHY